MRQALGPGALGGPGGSGWGGRWEGGSGWGTHVNSKKITTTKKIDKPLVRLIRKKKRKVTNSQHCEADDMNTADSASTRMMTEYCEQLYGNSRRAKL